MKSVSGGFYTKTKKTKQEEKKEDSFLEKSFPHRRIVFSKRRKNFEFGYSNGFRISKNLIANCSVVFFKNL